MDESILMMSRDPRKAVDDMHPIVEDQFAGDTGSRKADEEPEIWLTVEEVESYLRVSKTTIYKMIREGAIPAARVGRALRIGQRELNKALLDQEKD